MSLGQRIDEVIRGLEAVATQVEKDRRKDRVPRAAGKLRDAIKYLTVAVQERNATWVENERLRRELVAALKAAQPQRVRLPSDRPAVTRQFKVPTSDNGPLKIYAHAGCYEDGRLGELFISCDKAGSLSRGAFDAVAMAISIGLQHGVPLEAYTSKLVGMRFEPSGFTGDKTYPTCTSVLDLIGRWLRDRFSKKEAA